MPRIEHTDFTHKVTEAWVDCSPEEQILKIQSFMLSYPEYEGVVVKETFKNGHVILRIEKTIPANIRGLFLLELEKRIKEAIDVGLTIWLEPVGDKSKLRQLRGVEIKT